VTAGHASALEVLEANDRCTVADMVDLQLDTVSLPAREIVPLLVDLEPRDPMREPRTRELLACAQPAFLLQNLAQRHVAEPGVPVPENIAILIAPGRQKRVRNLPARLAVHLVIILADEGNETLDVLGQCGIHIRLPWSDHDMNLARWKMGK
jgi:hypothetical protein